MKTLFICAQESIHKHVDEEYDEILYVSKNVSAENLQDYHFRIKDAIRLVNSQFTVQDTDRHIKVFIDAPGPFGWICQQLQIEMKETDQINIILPEFKENPLAADIIREADSKKP